MKVSTTTIEFRIDIDFDGCDVDMVYNEIRARGVSTAVPSLIVDYEAKGGFGKKPKKVKLKGNKTPTELSVDFALHWLAGYVDKREMCITNHKQDKDYGADWITVKDETGFEYATKPDAKTELEEMDIKVKNWYGLMMGTCHLICEVEYDLFTPKLVERANKIVASVFNRFIQYYRQKKTA